MSEREGSSGGFGAWLAWCAVSLFVVGGIVGLLVIGWRALIH